VRKITGLIICGMLLCTAAIAQYTDVADIAAARALSDSTSVKILGKVKVIGYNKLYYGDFVVQDSSGADGQSAIFVYYGSRVTCNDGDTISGLYGLLNTYGGMRELSIQPSEVQTPTAYTGGDALPAIVPLQLTGTEFTTNYANYDCEIVKVIGSFDSPSGTFAENTNYPFTTQDLTPIIVRIRRDTELEGAAMPSGTQAVIGIAAIYNAATPPEPQWQIWPMYSTDIQPYAAPTATPTPPPTPTPYGEASVHRNWSIYE
jgi:hypothetical protein